MQITIGQSVSISGVGLHSGQNINLTLHPAAENSGITFIRIDVTQDKDRCIQALWNNVVDTKLCTVISNQDGVSVGTIEHLMAALRGSSIDNVVVEIDGSEVPIMDGSAMPFITMIENAGSKELNAPKKSIRILKEVTVEKDGKVVTLAPSAISEFVGDIEFDHPSIGSQSFETQLVNGDFKHDIAEARTFGFLHEVEYLRANGLALGGSLDNAIVLDEARVLNPTGLRFEDEFIRHKILDAIGDLYLAGSPILGSYDGHKAGHEMNNLILHALFADDSAWDYVESDMSVNQSLQTRNDTVKTAVFA
ncbi:UDP-3-O-acyl-N-acetylglucosamine deacetylase [Alphaproteobacteria bacterium]|nr:UDP-3-O-acyl-N-acetylglucosamine deacetylase [Alphaproteobacteria bacterium]